MLVTTGVRFAGTKLFVIERVNTKTGTEISVQPECSIFGCIRQEFDSQQQVLGDVLALVLDYQINFLCTVDLDC